MLKRGFSPNPFVYTAFIQSYCEEGMVEEAINLFQEMKSMNLSPYDETYSFLVIVCARSGKSSDGSRICEEMIQKGMLPNSSVFNGLVRGLCEAGVYWPLVPIIGGCGLAALTELNFNMTGFMGAMISNVAFVFRNIFAKRGMKGKSVSGMNYYACLSMLSLVILTPFAIAVEGPRMWAAGWQRALSEIGPNFVWWVAAQSVFYLLYNQVSYMSLDEISPLTFSIGNTMKRISVIVSSIIIFKTPIQPVNALGGAIAIFGTFLYSRAKQ